MELTEKQRSILDAAGHLLVTGGPGSGKTTVSILKAAKTATTLRPGQEVLFLSFARATIARVVEAIEREHVLPRAVQARINVETYHSYVDLMPSSRVIFGDQPRERMSDESISFFQ